MFTLEAYLATNERDLTNAMADFMDCSIVIPPTEIQDENMLKPIINFQKKMLRDRVRPYDTRLMVGGKGQALYNDKVLILVSLHSFNLKFLNLNKSFTALVCLSIK